MTFKQKLKNQEAVEEGCVTLRCELSKAGVPVEWRKDAQLVKEGEKIQTKQEGRVAEMLIRNVTLADSGEYSCSVGTVVTSADIKVRGMLHYSFTTAGVEIQTVQLGMTTGENTQHFLLTTADLENDL